jgi:glucose/arabinose dehydrogenase
MTSLQDGGFYGWPYSYYGRHVDSRVSPQRPDLVARAIVTGLCPWAHTPPRSAWRPRPATTLPAAFADGMFVGQHGSWNRRPHSGYKVIFVPFAGGKPVGPPLDVLTGFLSAEGKAYGRPVGVAHRQARVPCWSPTTSATWSGA